jgi:hypothetical protein
MKHLWVGWPDLDLHREIVLFEISALLVLAGLHIGEGIVLQLLQGICHLTVVSWYLLQNLKVLCSINHMQEVTGVEACLRLGLHASHTKLIIGETKASDRVNKTFTLVTKQAIN